MSRGQTPVDFLVAVTVFLVASGFVLGFIPGMLTPLGDEQAGPAVADRAAATLTGSLLAGPDPGTLDAACTAAFVGSGPDDGCPFDAGDPVATRLGVDGYEVNVTVERDDGSAVLCIDDGRVGDCATGGDRLAAGPPPSPDDVTVATRPVRVGGTDAVVVVRVS